MQSELHEQRPAPGKPCMQLHARATQLLSASPSFSLRTRPQAHSRDKRVMIKMYNQRLSESWPHFCAEVNAYLVLEHLQGQILARMHAYSFIAEAQEPVLILQHVGRRICADDEKIPSEDRPAVRRAVEALHAAVSAHFDLEPRNVAQSDSGEVFILNLDQCAKADGGTCQEQYVQFCQQHLE